MKTIARFSLVTCLLLAAAAPVSAQIYTWRDTNGNLVLSDKPVKGATTVRVFETPRPQAPFRTTRPAEMPFRGEYETLISKHSAAYGVPADLVRAVVQVESGFNPMARSSKGALGLMQLMPATAVEMGVRNPYDASENIRGGVGYLRQLLDRYSGDVTLALAAYNAGPTAVQRAGNNVPRITETRNYVARVTSRRTSTPNPGAVQQKDSGSRKPATPKPASPPAMAPAAHAVVYRTVEIINGRPVMKYSDTKPNGPYEVVARR